MLLCKHFENEFSDVLVDVELTSGVRTNISLQPKLRDIETLSGLVVDTSSMHLKAPSRPPSAVVEELSVIGLETTAAGMLVEPLDRHKKRARQSFSPPQHLKAVNEIYGYDYEFTTVPSLQGNCNSSALFPSAGAGNGTEAMGNDEEQDSLFLSDKISTLAQLVVDPSSAPPASKMSPIPSNDDIRTCISLSPTHRGAISPNNVPAPLCHREREDGLETNKQDYIKHGLKKMHHTFETLDQLVVDHSSSHSTTLRSSSSHVHEYKVTAKNKQLDEQQQLQSTHERNLKLLPIPSILNVNLETINENKEPTGGGYNTFGHQWAGGCILVSPPASMKL